MAVRRVKTCSYPYFNCSIFMHGLSKRTRLRSSRQSVDLHQIRPLSL